MTGENGDEEAAARVSWGVQASALHRAASFKDLPWPLLQQPQVALVCVVNTCRTSRAAFFRPTALFLYSFAIFVEFADLTRC